MSDCPICREQIEDMKEELLQLRALAFGTRFMPHPDWSLTRSESAVLQLLIARNVITLDGFEAAMRAQRWDWDAGEKLLHVMVCNMRKKLCAFGIEITTLWGIGYSLQPAVKALVTAACDGGPSHIGEPIGRRERSLTPEVLAFIAKHPEGVTAGMVASHFGDRRSAPAILSALTDRGLVRRSRPDELKRGYVYFPVTRRAA